jgi:hypothetical protein
MAAKEVVQDKLLQLSPKEFELCILKLQTLITELVYVNWSRHCTLPYI